MRSVNLFPVVMIVALTSLSGSAQNTKMPVVLFDGKTFSGWEGDTVKTWRISEAAIIGGSLTETVPHNNFLVTTGTYSNFMLRLKFRLIGTTGFINAGIQFHSRRLTNPPYEMEGYQADLGPGYWASLYDESRRNKTLLKPDSVQVSKWLKPGDWNNYEVRSENGRIRISLNGHQTVDYTEPDKSIPQSGRIGLQIHGGGKAVVAYKEIMLEELTTVAGRH
ncbi:MAG: DUF1080 domain-containing protein [Chitinophagaceae bacterium]